ncbi:MAG: tRNA (guanosine(46)-N7)-methyltransferase TrmB [Bacteroidales bacterium]|nr:tRNA (guanosine(46)-N7)-methyltransferase TrmB [Bacteroidales bacterium]
MPGYEKPPNTKVLGKKKLQRFAETETFPNFLQVPFSEAIHGFRLQGKWASGFFGNQKPIVLELGCGKGEYTVGLARHYLERNFIGVDIKGARMWRGARTALDEGIPNAAFLRTRIELIGHFFGPGEVKEIWITFPDPQLKQGRGKKRLTHPMFLNRYRKFLAKDHIIHLKTDSAPLYHYTLNLARYNGFNIHLHTEDLYAEVPGEEAAMIQTFYESMWLKEGLKIHYLRFSMDTEQPALSLPEPEETEETLGQEG